MEPDLDASHSLQEWLDAIAAGTPAPGGGPAAALAAANAAALAGMVARLSGKRGRRSSGQAGPDGETLPAVEETAARADQLRQELLDLAARDMRAVSALMAALTLPHATKAEATPRRAARDAALLEAAGVQLELLQRAEQVAGLGLQLVARGRQSAVGDAAAAVFLATGAARTAYWNVRANVRRQTGKATIRRMLEDARAALERAEANEDEVRQALAAQLTTAGQQALG